MGFKVSVELDESKLASQSRHAASTVQSEFQKIDPAGSITKRSRDAFQQIENDARKAGNAIGTQLRNAEKANVFGRLQQSAKTAFDNVARYATAAGNSILQIGKNALGVFGGNLITSSISKFVDILADIPGVGFRVNATIEQLSAQMLQLTQDAKVANTLFAQFSQLAAKTSFGKTDIVAAGTAMLTYGFNAKQTSASIKAVVDAASVGLDPAQSLKTISSVIGQIRQRSVLATQDVRQLTDIGLPVFDILAKRFGTTADKITEAIESGAIKGTDAAAIILQGFATDPRIVGAADRLSKTYLGKMSTAKDEWENTLGEAAKPAFEKSKETLDQIIGLLSGSKRDQIVATLQPMMEAPVTFANGLLKALDEGKVKDFGAQVAKDVLQGATDVITGGMQALYEKSIKPQIDSIIDQIKKSFADAVADIKSHIPGLGGAGTPTIPQVVTPFVPQGSPIVPGLSFPGLGLPVVPSLDGIKKGLGLKAFPGAGALNFGQNIPGLTVAAVLVQQPPKPITAEQFDKIIREGQKKAAAENSGGGTPDQQAVEAARRAARAATAAGADVIIVVPGAAAAGQTIAGGNVVTNIVGGPGAIATITAAQAGIGGRLSGDLSTANGNLAASTDEINALEEAFGKLPTTLNQTAGEASRFALTVQDTVGTFFDALIVGAAGVGGAFRQALRVVQQSVSSFIGQTVNGLLFGSSSTAAGGTGGAGVAGGLLGGIFGGGGGGGGFGGFNLGNLFKTPPFVGGGSGGGGGAAAGAAGTITKGLGFGGKLGSFLAPLLGPALLGGSLGVGLGGGSRVGRILGAAGGAVAGIGIAGGVSVGLAGGGLAIGALAALGPLALIAAPLFVGAILLGKASQRKKDEQAADAIWVEEMNQTRALVAAVKSDRIEGSDALAQWASIRQNTIAQLSQIKTKSVRESRLNNQLADLDRTVVAELRQAAEQQTIRRLRAQKLIPQFATGGIQQETGLAYLHEGEAVLTRRQQAAVGGAQALAAAGVPGAAAAAGSDSAGAPNINVQVQLILDDEDAAAIVTKGVRQPDGRRAVVSVSNGKPVRQFSRSF